MKINKQVLDLAKQNIRNSFSEDGKAAADAVIAALDALENGEGEMTAEDVKKAAEDAVNAILGGENLPEQVTEKIRKMTENAVKAEIKNAKMAMNATAKSLPAEVRNKVATAILNCKAKSEVKDAVMNVLTENGITGLEYAQVIDYTIVDNWGDSEELYNAFNVTPVTEWFYTDQDIDDADILAHGWTDESEGEKVMQEVVATPVVLNPDYVYKGLDIKNSQIAKMRKAGNEAQFISWITNELRRQNHNTQVAAILVGDQFNEADKKIDVFDPIKRAESDAFVSVSTAAENGTNYATIEEVRAAADKVEARGNEVWAVMSRQQLTALAAFHYGEGGTEHYRSKEEVAGQLGVDKIFISKYVSAKFGCHAIILTPKEYWVNRDNADTIEVAYPKYDTNTQKFLYEEYTAGAPHGLFSAAVVLSKAEPSTSRSASRSKSKSASV